MVLGTWLKVLKGRAENARSRSDLTEIWSQDLMFFLVIFMGRCTGGILCTSIYQHGERVSEDNIHDIPDLAAVENG